MKRRISLFVLIALAGAAAPALAIPTLQLYVEGGVYDPGSESWVKTGGGPFKIWVLADVAKWGTIFDVRLAAAVATSAAAGGGSIALSPTSSSLMCGSVACDPSVAGAATQSVFGEGALHSADGAVPIMGDGKSLPTHDIYGPGTSFFEWHLGDFTLTDSPLGDFDGSLPFPTEFSSRGTISAFSVTLSGIESAHFDGYGMALVGKGKKARFVPFSHDVDTVHVSVPEPGTFLFLGFGLVGLGAFSSLSRMRSWPTRVPAPFAGRNGAAPRVDQA